MNLRGSKKRYENNWAAERLSAYHEDILFRVCKAAANIFNEQRGTADNGCFFSSGSELVTNK
jgi:hypothetical protein